MSGLTTAAVLSAFLLTSLPAPALAYQVTTRPVPPRPLPPRPVPLPQPVRPEIQPLRPTYPPGNRGYAGTIRCESKNNKSKRCAVRTENRVKLVRQLNGTTCRQGRGWNYDRNSITVTRGCRAEFAYGYGNHGGYPTYPERDDDKGPSTGAIIAGVAVAGGLIALLATSGKKKKAEEAAESTPTPAPGHQGTFPAGPPAQISANFADLPAEARPTAQTCMFEIARQIGATGGTKVRYDRLISLEPGNGGWRIRAALTATYPDGDRAVPAYCRATPTKVVELTFG